MIAYRCLTNNEILGMINDTPHKTYTIQGKNTFKYDRKKDYKHFFVYAEHAEYYRKESSKKLYPVIGQYVIPDELIEQYGFGFYSNVETSKNNVLSSYCIPLPEIIINELYFSKSYLYKVESDLYLDFITKKLDNDDNELYNEPIEEYYNYEEGIYGYLDYSYADVYYEMIHKFALENNMNMSKVLSKINPEMLHEEIQLFYEKNNKYIKKHTRKYLKEKNK